MAGKLPNGWKEKDLVPDPHGRAGVWLHKPTDTPINMGLDYRADEKMEAAVEGRLDGAEGDGPDAPSGYDQRKGELAKMNQKEMFAVAEQLQIPDFNKKTKKDLMPAILLAEGFLNDDTMRGKRIEITFGRFEGLHGTVTSVEESDENEEPDSVEVLLDGDGGTISLDEFTRQARFLTADEIAADEAALKEKQKAEK
jgi:hypothetical protein